MMRKVISIFFVLIFIMQILPVRQVGRILFQASMIEELPEKGASKATTGLEDHSKAFLVCGNNLNVLFRDDTHASYIHHSETLPVLRASDVQTPPPDFL